jgi:hypothetical protein
MAKELKTKLVLELDDFSRKLTKAERDYKKTIANIEKESGKGIESIRRALGSGALTERDARGRFVKGSPAEAAAAARELGMGRNGTDPAYSQMVGTGGSRKSSDYAFMFDRAQVSLRGVVKTAALVAAGIEAADVATALFTGDITTAADKIKSMPLGVGHVATALESLLGTWTGIQSEIDANNSSIKYQEAMVASLTRNAKERLQYEREMREIANAAKSEASVAGLTGDAKQDAQLYSSQDKAEQRVRDRLQARKEEIAAEKKARRDALQEDAKTQREALSKKNATGQAIAALGGAGVGMRRQLEAGAASAKLEKDLAQRKAALDRWEKNETQKAEAEAQRALGATKEEWANKSWAQEAEQADRMMAEKKKQYSDIDALEASIDQQRLIKSDKFLDAELAGIRESGRRKAQEFRDQKNELAARKQEELTELEVANRKKAFLDADDEKRASAMADIRGRRGQEAEKRLYGGPQATSGNAAITSSFLTRTPGTGAQMLDVARRQLTVMQETKRGIDELARKQDEPEKVIDL